MSYRFLYCCSYGHMVRKNNKKIKEYLLLLIQICPGKNQDRRLQNIRNQGTNGIFEGWKGTCYGKSTMKAKINVA